MMKRSTTLTFAAAALLVTGSALACPNKDKQKSPGQDGAEQEFFDVIAADENAERPRRERAERGEKGERGEQADRSERREKAREKMGLTEDQMTAIKKIVEEHKEQAKELMVAARESKQAGEEVDREALREKLKALRESSRKAVYDNVLTDEQRAMADKRREAMQERRAKRAERGEGEARERRQRPERPERKRGGSDEGLDL